MVLSAKETTIAYRCPSCGQTVVSLVGVFALTGDLIKLKCNCNKSELQITYTADRKIRLSVPCLVCGKSHSYVLGSGAFFDRDLLALSCSCCGIDICFIGKKEKVLDAAATADRELLEMMEEAGMCSFDELHEPNQNNNLGEDYYFIQDILNFILTELQEENQIHCACRENDTPIYRYHITPGEDQSVEIFCETCGASIRLPITDIAAANALLNLDSLQLTLPQSR